MATVIIEASARHIHVTAEALHMLFGEGYQLQKKRELSMPGEFLSDEKVRVEGPRGALDRVSILGPVRKAVQVEISLTDARVLGVNPPVRLSGDTKGSAAVKLIGPAGELELSEGCIVAKRHIHMTPEFAAQVGVVDGQHVSVKVAGERGVTFDETMIRVNANFANRMHIDFDECNAAGMVGEIEGTIIL